MKQAKTRSGLIVRCSKDFNLETLTRKMCRECSLCNNGLNCNNTSVNPQEFDSIFAGKEEDLKVYNTARNI